MIRKYEDCVDMIRLFRKISYIRLNCDLGTANKDYGAPVYMKENYIGVKHIDIQPDRSISTPKMKEYVWSNFLDVSLADNPLNFK